MARKFHQPRWRKPFPNRKPPFFPKKMGGTSKISGPSLGEMVFFHPSKHAKAITQHGRFPPWLNIFCEIFQGEMRILACFASLCKNEKSCNLPNYNNHLYDMLNDTVVWIMSLCKYMMQTAFYNKIFINIRFALIYPVKKNCLRLKAAKWHEDYLTSKRFHVSSLDTLFVSHQHENCPLSVNLQGVQISWLPGTGPKVEGVNGCPKFSREAAGRKGVMQTAIESLGTRCPKVEASVLVWRRRAG